MNETEIARLEGRINTLEVESDAKDQQLKTSQDVLVKQLEELKNDTSKKFDRLENSIEKIPAKVMAAVDKEIDLKTKDFVSRDELPTLIENHKNSRIGAWLVGAFLGGGGVFFIVLKIIIPLLIAL